MIFKKLIIPILLIPVILVSCDEENADTTAPGVVTHVQATALDQSVQLQWANPADPDFNKVLIRYTNEIEYNIEVLEGVQVKTIEGLKNNQEYSFYLKTVDLTGNESDEVQVTATPLLTIAYSEATEIEEGTYMVTDEFDITTTYKFSGANGLNITLTAGANTFRYTGTWSRTGLSAIIEVVNLSTHIVNIDTVSAAFSFGLDGDQYYYHGAYEKISGESDELTGEYSYSILNGGSSFSRSITIATDSTYQYFENESLVGSGTISIDDIRNHKLAVIGFMGKTFLYWEKSFVLKRQTVVK
mgnify:CR=1 FL=1